MGRDAVRSLAPLAWVLFCVLVLAGLAELSRYATLASGEPLSFGLLRQVLLDAVSALGESAAVELTGIDADAACYRVVVSIVPELGAGQIRIAMAEALHDAGIGDVRSNGAFRFRGRGR